MCVMQLKRIFPLKYKLLFLLTIVPVVSLAIYILLATRLFEQDKIAYVKDTSVAVAKSLSIQFRLEVGGFVEKVRPIIDGYDFSLQKFGETAELAFRKQERLDALIVYQKNIQGNFTLLGVLKKNTSFANDFTANIQAIERIRNKSEDGGLLVEALEGSDFHLVIANTLGDRKAVDHFVMVGLYRATDLYRAFTSAKMYEHYLLNRSGKVELGPKTSKLTDEVFGAISKTTLPEGAIDVPGKHPLIVSYADTGVEGMKILASVDRNQALVAVNALLWKSLLFFVTLIATTVIVSLIASVSLTSTIKELYEATRQIAQGKFDIRVKSRSNDEVGGLAEGFNFMAEEVSRLMKETSEKARMANELETVKIVQDNLLPKSEHFTKGYSIAGHFEPASECGGDWWNYNEVGDKLFLWIGDATGHGAPAAMVTSAAKSVSTIIEDMPEITPSRALAIMNKAIHGTAKGKILMTFFLACIDTKTGEMTFANASHEPPYLIRNSSKLLKVTKKDLEPIMTVNGPRLGDKVDSTYQEGKIIFAPGDAILFYTDGVVDLKNAAGKPWGERGFIKSICESATNGKTAIARLDKIRASVETYREKTVLPDDITLLICQHGEVA
jgi:sigma-B regulation protein RsbU (phosphoserine phosphatase)